MYVKTIPLASVPLRKSLEEIEGAITRINWKKTAAVPLKIINLLSHTQNRQLKLANEILSDIENNIEPQTDPPSSTPCNLRFFAGKDENQPKLNAADTIINANQLLY